MLPIWSNRSRGNDDMSMDEEMEDFMTGGGGGKCPKVFRCINGSMRKVGSVLVICVYLLAFVITFTSYAIILPYEQLYRPLWAICIYAALGLYLLINVLYHYTKARTLLPFSGHGKEGDRWCHTCRSWKCPRTHHCSVCNKCIFGMDHHCIWTNQCIGAHNHRHFFLFISFLTVTGLLVVIVGYHAFRDFSFNYNTNYCNTVLAYAPLQFYLCEQGQLAKNLVIFSYVMSSMLILVVGGLTGWTIFLVTKGFTYLDYLLYKINGVGYSMKKHRFNKRPNPYDFGWKQNWINFLGLRRDRTFLCNVLLPSSHAPTVFDENGEPEIITVHPV